MQHQEKIYTCYLCGSTEHQVLDVVNQKPKGETDYGIAEADYQRVITQCQHCQVYTNQHQLLDQRMYEGDYNASISLGSIRDRYDKVMHLPPEKSDNRQRVDRILEFLKSQDINPADSDVLDVGSGTCVFLGALKEAGPRCACIDPDPQAIAHASQYVGIPLAHCGTLEDFSDDQRFDLITFNKVLEHVKNPVAMLEKASRLLNDHGIVYLELPEGERAVEQHIETQRQEFFVEHYTIFNETSYMELARKAGYDCLEKQVITEPSGKLTICGFLKKQ